MKTPSSQATPRRSSKLPWLLCGLVGLFIGLGSAFAVSSDALSKGNLEVGRWSTNPNVGAKAADPWLRARIARVGLLALTKEETIYFDRQLDETGNPLREACTYRLSGGAIPARWWSITIYGADQMLPRNNDGVGSIDATRALPDGQLAWTGLLSATKPTSNALWLSSKSGGVFSLTLRLYNPASVTPEALSVLTLPKVELISCSDDVATGAKP